MFTSKSEFRATRGLRAFAVAATAAALAIPAQADMESAPFVITAYDHSSGLTASVEITDGSWDEQGNFRWSSTTPMDFVASGNLIGVLNPVGSDGSSFEYNGDPIVNLSFSVAAGPSTTSFMISSALLSFPAISSPVGRASVAYSVTDADGDGALLQGTGGYSGSAGYTAQYNGIAGIPNGTSFVEVLPSIAAASFDTSTSPDTTPALGYLPLPVGSVSSMSTYAGFTLSANDLASGTSTFEIIPEPTSLLLLVVGGALIRRR